MAINIKDVTSTWEVVGTWIAAVRFLIQPGLFLYRKIEKRDSAEELVRKLYDKVDAIRLEAVLQTAELQKTKKRTGAQNEILNDSIKSSLNFFKTSKVSVFLQQEYGSF
jgi:hypothetical protein